MVEVLGAMVVVEIVTTIMVGSMLGVMVVAAAAEVVVILGITTKWHKQQVDSVEAIIIVTTPTTELSRKDEAFNHTEGISFELFARMYWPSDHMCIGEIINIME